MVIVASILMVITFVPRAWMKSGSLQGYSWQIVLVEEVETGNCLLDDSSHDINDFEGMEIIHSVCDGLDF